MGLMTGSTWFFRISLMRASFIGENRIIMTVKTEGAGFLFKQRDILTVMTTMTLHTFSISYRLVNTEDIPFNLLHVISLYLSMLRWHTALMKDQTHLFFRSGK